MNIPMVDLKGQYETIKDEVDTAILQALAETRFILGPNVQAFDQEAGDYLGAKHAISCASGTDALHLGLLAAGIKSGDEIITSAFTFIATGEAIRYIGAEPVFVDIQPHSLNIDPALIRAAITDKTRAILPVHLFGLAADMTEIQALADKTLAHRGLVSYKTNPDGSYSVYELNITLFDALSNPNSNESDETQINRFMVSQTIMLALVGVPGIYIHSLAGSHNNLFGVQQIGHARSINRQKWQQAKLETVLANPNSTASKVFSRYRQLLQARAVRPAFHPKGKQEVIRANPAVFALLRTSPDGKEQALCLHNVSNQTQIFEADVATIASGSRLENIFSGGVTAWGEEIFLKPYALKWLSLERKLSLL